MIHIAIEARVTQLRCNRKTEDSSELAFISDAPAEAYNADAVIISREADVGEYSVILQLGL